MTEPLINAAECNRRLGEVFMQYPSECLSVSDPNMLRHSGCIVINLIGIPAAKSDD
ncbi:hypothetical protein S101468_03301 (plasmid) [Acetobacter pasteurianus subsp. pasteurianus]|uniref:Uncharacterized protein n=1 Tax=Acetobacter pasteurianus subsp. pasteurianus TaxID=481145 RepID=A0AAC9SVQ4_ACEPA|nr:hypothetical protein [Acetobacter pasteurianus]ASC07502.1 hypothetical protein S101468_03301 [Acetobacter pasteurianus subsp. pasteurianus]